MSVSATIDDIWLEFVATRRPALRDELIVAYAPLVRFVVGRLGIPPTSILDQEDLISYGVIGLINAIDRFDPSRGIRFEAFATSRIRGAVIDQLRSLNWMPRSAVTRVRQVEGALAELEQRLGRTAKEEEVVAELQVSTGRYRQMLQEAGTMILSLDAPLSALPVDDSVTSLADLLEDMGTPGPAEQLEQNEMLQLLSQSIDHLPPRERMLLSLYYQEELTMKEISKLLYVSESRVCQLHMQAILRLRAAMNVRHAAEQAAQTAGSTPRVTVENEKRRHLSNAMQVRW
ncbi:MAG TPA: FliA/WhiG family RNA polymerase sigma factor [Ktedonobacteraceae bacterium]|nr:FliA/WhiG family RNA polymerase sigma factor [Ktedonobacteraceae bacterium]